MKVMEQLIAEHPRSRYLDEVQFRRANISSARSIAMRRARMRRMRLGVSEYYELALAKLGWTLYKQEFYEEALHRYFSAARLQGGERLRLRCDTKRRRSGIEDRSRSSA
jgi:hypothetical protein